MEIPPLGILYSIGFILMKGAFWSVYTDSHSNRTVGIFSPALAWGFYGHRLQLYRKTTPHNGYKIILKWIEELSLDHFIFTSNVDAHFQKVGFDENKIYECHGSIMQFQCSHNCGQEVWMPSPDFQLLIEERSLEAKDPLPLCPRCKSM